MTINHKEFDPSIDPGRLDWEWLRQATMYHATAVMLADARRKVDEAKQTLDVTKAETLLSARRNPADYRLEKPTVDAYEAAVSADAEVRLAQKELIEAKHDAEIMSAAVYALDHKKRALENLTTLQGRDMSAEPRARTEDGKAAIAAHQDKDRRGGQPLPDDWE